MNPRFSASWRAELAPTAPGYSVLLLPKNATYSGDPAEPNQADAFGVGFDTSNPRPFGTNSNKWFGPAGNFYDRPQREISLHRNGREIANILCPVPLTTHGGNNTALDIEYVSGGALVTVTVDGTKVYDRYFVPELFPTHSQFTTAGNVRISGLRHTPLRPLPVSQPNRVVAFDKVLNDAQHHRQTNMVAFPENTNGVGRVVVTLRLDATPKGIDPWDRLANLYLYDDSGERFEILRWITPYRKAWEWKADVTDFLPLLKGKKKLEASCETYAEGWLVTLTFDFYPGRLERVPYKVVNLWSGAPPIGLADQPVEKFFLPRTVDVDRECTGARFRSVVTGHGMEPNTDNAGEFHPLWRKLHVNGQTWQNNLWKEDVYLNPCRPQGGTWKFDRAGWAPGDLVTPWTVDLDPLLRQKRSLTLGYEIQPYVNRTPNKDYLAQHRVEAQLILYRRP